MHPIRPALVALAFCASCASTIQPPSQGNGTNQNDGAKASGASGQGSSPERGAIPRTQGTVVTARKIEEELQDVPRSITAIDADRIESQGIQNLRDASIGVPNLLITEFSSRRLSLPYVRGVGSGQGDPAVATFIDGVPQLTTNTTNLPLTDVDRIEFIRGPLSTLYGRNTIGGAIQIVTKPPSNDTTLNTRATVGNFRYQNYEASFSTPLVKDELFLGLSVVHNQREGYTDNDFYGNDADSRDTWFGRGQLVWTPDAQNELRFVIHGERARDGGFVLGDLGTMRSRPNHINQDFDGSIDRDVISNSLIWNRYGEDIDFTSITSIQDWDIFERADFDFSQIDGIRRFTKEDQTAFTQELRFSSAEDADVEIQEDVTLKWVAGVMGFYSDSGRSAENVFRPAGAGILFPPNRVGTDRAQGSFDDFGIGVFGQATTTIGDALEITGAIRYDYENKDAKIRREFETTLGTLPLASTDTDDSFDEWLPRASIAYRIAESTKVYGVAARGFKAGGFNLTAPTGRETFGPETSWTYEVGVKNSWEDLGLTANVSLFHIDWDDMQLSQFDATSGGYVTNAGEAESQGIEIEASYEVIDNLDVFGGFGILSTEFERFTDSFGTDVRGRNLPFAPEHTANIGASYAAALDDDLVLRVGGDYQAVGKFFYDAGNRANERYGLANFRAGIGNDRMGIDFWVRNAFDQRYQQVAFQPNPANPNQFVAESSAPRTFGVSLRFKIGPKPSKKL